MNQKAISKKYNTKQNKIYKNKNKKKKSQKK